MWRGSAFSLDGIGFITMGVNNSNYNHHMYKYNDGSDTWQMLSNISFPALTYIGTAVVVNKMCLYGGADSSGNITNALYIFNPADTSVASHAGIPTFGRKGGMAFSANNSFYLHHRRYKCFSHKGNLENRQRSWNTRNFSSKCL